MKAVILAAGEGKRMRPLTYVRPKVMLPIAGKPIIEHLIEEVKAVGITEFIIVVGYHDETIRGYFSNGADWGIDIQYVTQKQQLGTADALLKVENLIDDAFLMLNGDTIVNASDIKRVAEAGKDKGNGITITLGVIDRENPGEYGVVEIEGDRIVKIHEKMPRPPTNTINAGVYLLNEAVFGALKETERSKRGEFELTDSLQLLIDSGEPVFWTRIEQEHWLDVSYPWDLLRANETMMEGEGIRPVIRGELEDNVELRGKVAVGEGTSIKCGTYIEGPVIIGPNCKIGPNCYIRAKTAIGKNCHIGNAVEIKNSIIMDNTKIPHLSYVGDSVIASHCNLGAGTKIANLRFDEASVKAAGMDTGRRKFGAILSDGVKTGINACIDAGTIIGNNTLIGPGALASGYIKENSYIF